MKRLGDFTLNEIKAICEMHRCEDCMLKDNCPIIKEPVTLKLDKEYDEQGITNKKPKKYRPFKNTNELIETWEELRYSGGCTRKWKEKWEMPLIWVKKNIGANGNILITSFSEKNVFIANRGFNLDELFAYYSFLDGTPCGVKEM